MAYLVDFFLKKVIISSDVYGVFAYMLFCMPHAYMVTAEIRRGSQITWN